MIKIKLEHPLSTGIRNLPLAEFALVRDLHVDEPEELANAGPDEILARICGMSPFMVSQLTTADRANIVAARRISKNG